MKESFTVQGRVTRVASEPVQSKAGDYLFRGLELSDEQTDGRLFVLFPETLVSHGRPDLFAFPCLCWEGSKVRASDLAYNNTLADGATIYAATLQSMVILEPFRHISVSDAVDASLCPTLTNLKYRMRPGEPFWMAKGSMIHSMFAQLLRGIRIGKRVAFHEAFYAARAVFLAALPGSKVRFDERSFMRELEQHYENMASWMERHHHLGGDVCTEVDRLSSVLGLKGRADAVFTNGDGASIVELKTGKKQLSEHQDQLHAYALLFAQESRLPDGYLLYSGPGTSQRRRGGNTWRVIEGRNRAVHVRFRFSQDSALAACGQDGRSCPLPGACFSRGECQTLFGAVSGHSQMFPSQKAQEFYSEWFHLLSKEAWFLETRLATAFDPSTLNDRVEMGETFRVVQVEPWSRHGTDDAGEPAGQPPWTNSDHSFVQLSFGDSPADLVYGQEVILHEGDPAAPTSWRGRIYHVDYDGAVVLRVQRAGMDGSGREEDFPDTMYLDQLPFLRAIEVARRSLLDFFLHGDQEVIRIVAGGADGETMDASNGSVPNGSNTAACVGYEGDLLYSDGLAGELNEAQEQALNSALQGSPYHLIHGPPGTGKTRVVSRLISRCLDRGDRVLLVCPTNVALDRVMAAVLELGASNMLRVGGSHSVTPALAYLLDRVSGPGILLDDLLAGDYRLPDFVKMVNATPLIGATAYQVASHHLFLAQKFDLVVVDEAGQLDEPSTLAALALAPRFVLCGDPFQLSPVVQHACGASPSGLALQRSLMERLMAGTESHRISRLTVQYRMNREIQDIPGRLFYRGLLHPSPEVAGRRLSIPARISKNGWIDRILDPDRPAVFVNVEGPECGAARREEADVVVTLVQALLKCGIPPEEIGVITPYRAQQSLIRKELGSRTNVRSAVSVDTVDRFQGGEREVILLSLARSDGVTSFLADPKRLNVSLSRARSKLVLLGRGSVLEGHSLFRDLLAGLDRVDVSRESCNDLPA